MRVIAAFLVAFCLPVLSSAAVGVVGNGAEVTCGTSPTVMDDPSIEDRYTRTLLACVPAGSNHVFVGGEGVTVGSGLEIGGEHPIELVDIASRYPTCVVGHVERVETTIGEGEDAITLPARPPYLGVCCTLGCKGAEGKSFEYIPFGVPMGYAAERAKRHE